MLIGQPAKIVSVNADTPRHYERKGVIASPVRSTNGYRLYLPETVERVKPVRRALAVGFTLDELAAILAEREKGGTPCRQAFLLANSKLKDLDDRIIEMQNLRDELKTLVRNWADKDALPAIYEFLRFHISDHQTGIQSKYYRSKRARIKL